MDKSYIWLIIAALGLGSFGLRFVFIGLIGDRSLPEWVLRHLRYTAVAVLPALIAPLVVWPAANGGETEPARILATLVTFALAYFVKNFLLSVFGGAATLFLGLWLF